MKQEEGGKPRNDGAAAAGAAVKNFTLNASTRTAQRRATAKGENSKGIARREEGDEGATDDSPKTPAEAVRTTFPIYARQRETNLQWTPPLNWCRNPRFILAYRHRKENAGEMLCWPTPSSLILPLTHDTNDSTRVHTDGRNRRPQPQLQLRCDTK